MMANYSVTPAKTLGQIVPEHVLRTEQWCEQWCALPVSGLELDSRKVEKGDVFFACKGVEQDGRQFIQQAVANGAIAVMYDSADDFTWSKPEMPALGLAGLSAEVGLSAAQYFSEPADQLFCIGVTGTNGKTTCSAWLAQLLSKLGGKTGLIGTLGQGLLSDDMSLQDTGHTTPDPIRLQKALYDFVQQGAENLVMEVSSHSLDQGRVSGIGFNVALFTNLSRDHLDYHGTMEGYGASKAKLFAVEGLSHAVINLDDGFGQILLGQLSEADVTNYSYSLVDSSASVYLKEYGFDVKGVKGILVSPWGEERFSAPVYGEFNVLNLLGVITSLCASGFTLQEVLPLLSSLEAPAGRFEKITAEESDITVFVDYAHTPDALEKALCALKPLTESRLWCVFGCGGDRDQGKRPLMGNVASEYADAVVLTSDNPRTEAPDQIIAQVLEGVKENTSLQSISDREEAIRYALKNAQQGDVVLIAGKGHEAYQEIDKQKVPFSDVEVAKKILKVQGGQL